MIAAWRSSGRSELTEGFVDFRGYRTWYRTSGEAARGAIPLRCLHGGPGSSSAYFAPLRQLAEREVVVYDQLGCGESDRPDDVRWSLELFVDEVDAIREHSASTGSTCSGSPGEASWRSSTCSAAPAASAR
jgi:hypothetical protein